jgi:hypothetical protein
MKLSIFMIFFVLVEGTWGCKKKTKPQEKLEYRKIEVVRRVTTIEGKRTLDPIRPAKEDPPIEIEMPPVVSPDPDDDSSMFSAEDLKKIIEILGHDPRSLSEEDWQAWKVKIESSDLSEPEKAYKIAFSEAIRKNKKLKEALVLAQKAFDEVYNQLLVAQKAKKLRELLFNVLIFPEDDFEKLSEQ